LKETDVGGGVKWHLANSENTFLYLHISRNTHGLPKSKGIQAPVCTKILFKQIIGFDDFELTFKEAHVFSS